MALASCLTFGLQLCTLQSASILRTSDRVVFLKLCSEHVILFFKPVSGSPVLRMRPNSWGPAPRPCRFSYGALSCTYSSSADGLQQLDPLLQTLCLALPPTPAALLTWGHILQHPALGMFPDHPSLLPSSPNNGCLPPFTLQHPV